MIRRSLEECLRVWYRAERRQLGDQFATAAELEGILSDPLGHADILKGTDAYTFVLAVLNEEIAGFEDSLAELGPEVASGKLTEAAAVAIATEAPNHIELDPQARCEECGQLLPSETDRGGGYEG